LRKYNYGGPHSCILKKTKIKKSRMKFFFLFQKIEIKNKLVIFDLRPQKWRNK